MKNKCIVRHCPNKAVWDHYNGKVYCERHKDLGIDYWWLWWRGEKEYGMRIHDGAKRPKLKRQT